MNHIYDLVQAQIQQPSIVTIGVFDGVHRGHQHLIRKLVEAAQTTNRQAVVLTFFPHPDMVVRGLQGRYYLTSPEQKAAELSKLGVYCVVTHAFDEQVRHIRAADFVDRLLKHLHMAELWVGSDFALGYQREGNVSFLKAQGEQKGFTVQEIDLLMNHGDVISSTTIREAIQAGDVTQAKDWLGRSYTVSGTVVHGEKRGRQIGFPTANLETWAEQVIPANGVYATWATVGSERFMAVTNIGVRPTFSGQDVTVEAHLLDFNRDIYGQELTLTFETRLRPEQRFNGIDELTTQIRRDVEAGRDYLSHQATTNAGRNAP
ncbi:MAG: bifunctional riboflavin kinase/FAD synthetase [Anaerolineaceae bacterium]|nr:bifunctional riboflavin kinase/FAD synthetase [Anaerolineaceae bacterium]